LLEQEVADLWALLRQFPEMKSSDLIGAKAAIMLHFAAICYAFEVRKSTAT
jgi:hypothetical protein